MRSTLDETKPFRIIQLTRTPMTQPAKTPGHRPRVEGERESEILDAALDLLARVGYDRMTMDAVAAEAKASKATLYRRWSTKSALVVDAILRSKEALQAPEVDTAACATTWCRCPAGTAASPTRGRPRSWPASSPPCTTTPTSPRSSAPGPRPQDRDRPRGSSSGRRAAGRSPRTWTSTCWPRPSPGSSCTAASCSACRADEKTVAQVVDEIILPAAHPATPPEPYSEPAPTSTTFDVPLGLS